MIEPSDRGGDAVQKCDSLSLREKNKDADMQIHLPTLADMVALEVLGCSPQLAVQRRMTQTSFGPEWLMHVAGSPSGKN